MRTDAPHLLIIRLPVFFLAILAQARGGSVRLAPNWNLEDLKERQSPGPIVPANEAAPSNGEGDDPT